MSNAISRFVSAGTPDAVSHFEAALFPPIQYMLSADVSGELQLAIIGTSIDHPLCFRIYSLRLPDLLTAIGTPPRHEPASRL